MYNAHMNTRRLKKREKGLGRDKRVTLRLTAAEKLDLEGLAKKEGLELAAYMRNRLLRKRVRIRKLAEET